MKKFLLLPMFLFLYEINAQQSVDSIKHEESSNKKWVEYFNLSDVTKSEKGWYRVKDKTISVKNGKKQDINANFSVSFEDYEPTTKDIDLVNIDMETVLFMTRKKLKNSFSFSPYDISFYRNKNGFKAYIKYTAKNDFGVEKDGIASYNFDLKGAYLP